MACERAPRVNGRCPRGQRNVGLEVKRLLPISACAFHERGGPGPQCHVSRGVDPRQGRFRAATAEFVDGRD